MLQEKSERELQSELNWHSYFIDMIKSVKKKSKDRHTQFGCIITGPGHEIRTTGYNSFPRGLDDSVEERYERPEKYFWMVHAEVNAIFNAARMGTSLDGCTAYIDALPCGFCSQGIVQVGIKEIVYDLQNWETFIAGRSTGMKTWSDDIKKACQMLKECGVKITPFTS